MHEPPSKSTRSTAGEAICQRAREIARKRRMDLDMHSCDRPFEHARQRKRTKPIARRHAPRQHHEKDRWAATGDACALWRSMRHDQSELL